MILYAFFKFLLPFWRIKRDDYIKTFDSWGEQHIKETYGAYREDNTKEYKCLHETNWSKSNHASFMQ